MKIAKATKEDIEAAVELNAILNNVEDGYYPGDGEDDPTFFDYEDSDHLRAFYDRVMECMNKARGGMNRVVWGFGAIMDSGAMNPNVDHLDFKPELAAGEELAAACRAIDADIERQGHVSAESVDLVRAALKMVEGNP